MYDEIIIISTIFSIILLMLIMRRCYFKYLKNDKNNQIIQHGSVENNISNNNFDVINEFMNEQQKIMCMLNKDKSFQFECVFDKNEPFTLLHVSNNFLNFLGMNSINDLIAYYNAKNSENHDMKYLNFTDLFYVNKLQYNHIVEAIKNNSALNDNNLKIELNLHVNDIIIEFIYNLDIDQNDCIVIKLKIYKIIPKKTFIFDSFMDTNNYSDIVHNIELDLPFPVIIVNCNGIKFINKCTCDWFNLLYFKTDENYKKNIKLNDIFDHIDNKLVEIINDMLKNSNSVGYYKEYYLNNNLQNKHFVNQNNIDLKLSNIPNEIVVKIVPFININNKKELFITINKANLIRSYIAKNSLDSSISSSYMINRDDPVMSKYINKLSNYNDFFKDFFKNTQMISFGRLDINKKKIIVCNELFEELIKYDRHKDRYIKLINNIISEYRSNGEESEDNLYIYDVIYTDKVTKIIYTYGNNVVDIILIENYFSEYLSNHSMKLLEKIYDTSDRPIIIVDNKASMLSYNKIFEKLYIDKKQIKENNNSLLSLLDFVPKSDRVKVKRAISDTIKFNSYNLKDVITLIDVNNDKCECKIQCLKTYGKINQEEFITVTFFPIKKNN